MFAAVVTSFGSPPRYQQHPTPQPRSDAEVLVDVIASGLHPRVRSQADGSHYTSTDELPLVPGIDGVGRTPDGRLRYFVLPDTTMGAMAEHTLIDPRRSVLLPEGSDPVLVAAAMNPAMSSWVALRRRTDFAAGQGVLVLGATGNAGRLAVQIAKHLGAGQVVAAGRDATAAGPTAQPGRGRRRVAGRRTERCRRQARGCRRRCGHRDRLSLGATHRRCHPGRGDEPQRSGPATDLDRDRIGGRQHGPIGSAALRAARLQIVGSGQGSVPTSDILAELAELAAQIGRGAFQVDASTVPLSEVETAWFDERGDTRRVVITAGR